MLKYACLLLIAALRTFAAPAQNLAAAVVATEYGRVQGYVQGGIVTYKGIPYAQTERFMPPQKPNTWQGVRSALAYGPVCPQEASSPGSTELSAVFQSQAGTPGEDCTQLNIWTPGVNDGKKRPVMVWLHGGSFVSGSDRELPAYDGENLSRSGDVVVVSLNHRLNVLGFLNLAACGPKYKASGNVGMMDIVAALEWVRGNIGRFGGDAGNVTVFGQSGGGGKVGALLVAPSAKGLFHKAIIQSGAHLRYNKAEDSQLVGLALLKELGLQPGQVDSLRTMPYERLQAASTRALEQVNRQLGRFGIDWAPSRDGDFILFQPLSEEALAVARRVPLLIGSTKNEAVAAFHNPGFAGPQTEAEARQILAEKYGNKTDAYIKAVRKAYPAATRPLDLMDVDVRTSVILLANHRAKAAPVYCYLFAWQSPVLQGRMQSFHCLELPFVFNNTERCAGMTGGGPEAAALAEKVSQAWVSFARTGNPSHQGLPTWKPYAPGTTATMIFDTTCELRQNHDKQLLELQ
ncbi:carboxylesterase/lipase family protein [Hymenobacter lucidus]|uniref:Carboxylic ester hydrolase n=1 Tax=Hymenobacter lucidus TaxID=2880930 RepID=A0ABS8AWS4_9BACT|nr:carboxylesterase family protein [Hymenobacter lucidus]MCB2410259.1 carboxylesterase family protein [Hymenobacter lucidus]